MGLVDVSGNNIYVNLDPLSDQIQNLTSVLSVQSDNSFSPDQVFSSSSDVFLFLIVCLLAYLIIIIKR